MRYIVIAISVLLLTASCNNNKMNKLERAGEPNIYITPGNDKKMNDAVAKAKLTLNEFDNAFRSRELDTSTCALKVRFPTEAGAEHIWATSIMERDGHYYGMVDNLPHNATQVKLGERIKINREDITDWMYADKGRLHGGYTIKLIRTRMTESEKKQFDASFPYRIEN